MAGNPNPSPETRFKVGNAGGPGGPLGNTKTLKHGGGAAQDALTANEPFKGLAAHTQLQVRADYESGGVLAMIEENAERLHTAARLYYNGLCKLADDGKLFEVKTLVDSFRGLVNAANRAWMHVHDIEGSAPKAIDYDELVKELKADAGRD